MDKVKLILNGFENPKQANIFIEWFKLHGEDLASDYMKDKCGVTLESSHSFGDSVTQSITLQIEING